MKTNYETDIVTFDGSSFVLSDLVKDVTRGRVKMEVTTFYTGDAMDVNSKVDTDYIMISIDVLDLLKTHDGPRAPFWLFKPPLFGNKPFADETNNKIHQEAFMKMTTLAKRAQAFGESLPLTHTNNGNWKHFILVTWIKKVEGKAAMLSVEEFLNDFKRIIMLPSCQGKVHTAARLMFAAGFSDKVAPLDQLKTEQISGSLWTNMHLAFEEPTFILTNRLKSKSTDEDIGKVTPKFFLSKNVPKEMFWSKELKDFVYASDDSN